MHASKAQHARVSALISSLPGQTIGICFRPRSCDRSSSLSRMAMSLLILASRATQLYAANQTQEGPASMDFRSVHCNINVFVHSVKQYNKKNMPACGNSLNQTQRISHLHSSLERMIFSFISYTCQTTRKSSSRDRNNVSARVGIGLQ
jgi:hypothetical protein